VSRCGGAGGAGDAGPFARTEGAFTPLSRTLLPAFPPLPAGVALPDDGADDASHAPERDEVFLAFLHEGATAGVAYYSSADGAIATTSVHCPEDDLGWIIGVVK
jgi:hypothetical protein